MVSCGSRKAILEKEKSEISVHEAEREKKDSTGISQTREHEEYSSISMDSGFSITPIGNTPAEFSFFYNGKKSRERPQGNWILIIRRICQIKKLIPTKQILLQ